MKRHISVVLCLLVLGLYTADDLHCKENRQALQNEAGFITIEPITFYFYYGSHFSRLLLKSSEARIWYSFHAADQNSDEKPFFMKSASESERKKGVNCCSPKKQLPLIHNVVFVLVTRAVFYKREQMR